ncbi:MAG: methyltransferase [bacterium]|nr:methyltransferase [bacterium]
MSQTSRELVVKSLTFEHPERMPRDMWTLPWALNHFPTKVKEILERFPGDFVEANSIYHKSLREKGDPYAIGLYRDEWGCEFTSIQAGVIGEVKTPLVKELEDFRMVKPPYEILPNNDVGTRDEVNRFCAGTDKFVKARCCPRPWERYQFIRGAENSLLDLGMLRQETRELLKLIHEFYLKELEFWVSTNVDGIMFMDDWGTQNRLLISPRIWQELFKPLYKEYCELAHAHGKFTFMHSDGNISSIYEDLIEIGVDALNSQLFCMDMENLAKCAKGRVTFWGEIDRQHVLPSSDRQKGRDAVRKVAHHFYDLSGGIIAQFELGAGANPATAMAIFEEWEHVQNERLEP